MEQINKLTKDSILEDELLAEVFDIEDEIYRARMLLALEDRAEELGVKTKFGKLVNAYKRERKKYEQENKHNQQSLDNMTDFGDEHYDQMRCGSWIADSYGVRTFSPFGGEILACYHPILPVQRLVNAETGKEKIKLAYRKGFAWKEIIVDKGVIASSNKIVGLADFGISVTSENARNLVRYLSDIENLNIDRITVETSTSKLGWIKGEFMPYGTDILFDNESRFKDAYESIREEGDRDTWYHLVKQIRKSERFEPKIYLAGAFASALIEPLNALPFIINLWGDTGKGKTVAIMLAASVWAYPGGNDYVTDPKSTVTALELRMDFLNNLPMLLDDMAQLKEKYQGDFSELVYMLCSGKGKDRANATLGLNKPTTWRNVILTNGEHSLVTETMQGGAVNRIIDVEMADGYIFEDGNEVVETLKKNFGYAGRDFIDALKAIGFERVREIQKDFIRRIKDAASQAGTEKEEKQILPMSIILTADQIATDYLFEDGIYMDFDYCVSLLKDRNEVSENDRAYEFIMSEVAINISKFRPEINGEYKGEVWGCFEKDYVVILSNAFNRICERGNFSGRAFLSWASKNNLLDGNGGKNTKPKRINGSLSRCVFIKLPEDEEKQKFQQMSTDDMKDLPWNT